MNNNPFKAIETSDRLPPETKKETLSNLYTLRLMLSVVDLFTVKAGGALTDAIGGYSPTDNSPSASALHE